MIQIDTKPIIISITIMMLHLTLTLPELIRDGFSQIQQKPDFQSNSNIDKNEINDNNTQNELVMQIQLEPHENDYLDDYYQISDFAFMLSNSSQLCPSGNCIYELEGGTNKPREFQVKDR